MADNIQEKVMDFERSRAQLMGVSSQKQQLQMQGSALENAIEELDKTKEKKVFKALGNILIQADAAATKKELADKKESADLRVKTLQKQEDSLINRLNKIKSEIEASQRGTAPETSVSETEHNHPHEKQTPKSKK